MRKITLLTVMFMPAFCLAYGEEASANTALTLYFLIDLLFFILLVVALFKIIAIAKNVKELKENTVEENPYYYYLMGDKDKAKEIMTKKMVSELEKKNAMDNYNRQEWKDKYDRIGCEIPYPLNEIKCLADYWELFEKK